MSTDARIHVAIGDPQAPLARFMAILDEHGLLAGDRLRDEVQLVSIGDHFDWGPPEVRDQATREAHDLLAWLAGHPPDQVVLLAGNHDLARVCELAHFADDQAYAVARAEADAAYRRGQVDVMAQAGFLRRYPFVATAECLARDLSCFSQAQRALVTRLLRDRRLRLAHAHGDLLLVHAGVTIDDLQALGITARDAAGVARALNDFLDDRVARWSGGPLDLEPLHRPGDAERGESRGALSHRPADPRHAKPDQLHGPPRRRFDPRRLPPQFAQAIGHVRDGKCRIEMPDWCDDDGPEGVDGPLRSLVIRAGEDGEVARYRLGVDDQARLIFIDGGMLHAAPGRYELLDLDGRCDLNRARRAR